MMETQSPPYKPFSSPYAKPFPLTALSQQNRFWSRIQTTFKASGMVLYCKILFGKPFSTALM